MTLWAAKLRCCIDALEQDAAALATDRWSIGHIAIGNALSYLDFRFGDLSWRDGHPRLAAWHAAFDARPSVVANPPVDDR
jgi:glutathione S-transferase